MFLDPWRQWRRRQARRRDRARLQIEILEDRYLPSSGPHLPAAAVLGCPGLPEARHAPAPSGPQAAEVTGFYRAYLHQKPTPGQLKQGVALVAAGAVEQLQAQILGSAAYFKKRARRKNDRFLAAAAQDVLGHPLDAARLQQLTALLASGTSRTAVAALIVGLTHGTPPQPQPQPQPPAVTILGPAAGLLTNHNVVVTGQVTGAASLQAEADGGPFFAVPFDAAGNFQLTTALPLDGSADGSHTVGVRATDAAGNLSALSTTGFTLDTRPPTIAVQDSVPGLTTSTNVTVTGRATDNVSGVASLQAAVDAGAFAPVAFDAAGNFQLTTALPLDGSADGGHTVRLEAADRAGNASAPVDVTFTLNTQSPGATTATTLADSTQFLYTGSNPVQPGVAPGTIDPVRAAVLRGRVQTRDGSPLAGVTLTVLNHPEFGHTLSRADGMFDLAVNGGARLTVTYTKDGLLTAQRQAQAPWQDYAVLPDVVLIPQDTQVSVIDLSAATPVQVARGSPMTDADGTRQATLLFPQGVQAAMQFADGSTRPLTVLHVRATEFTVGATGPEAMPADLPPSSGYTYAVEFHADEATAAGAKNVLFSQPLPYYVEDFLNFPVGMDVPLGSYNRDRGQWLASTDGRVVQVLGSTGSLADLDVDGSGRPASAAALAALGITDAERQTLATLYPPGRTLWRVPIAHFDAPWDANWPFHAPSDARFPGQAVASSSKPAMCPSTALGPVIDVQDQTLGETLPVTGTPFSLNYGSDRVPGRTTGRDLVIPLSDPMVPGSLKRIELEVDVAGRQFTQTFPGAPGQSTVFHWDGLDAYGRVVRGTEPVTLRIGYVFDGAYGTPAGFGNYGGPPASGTITANRTRQEITLWEVEDTALSAWDGRGPGLGGWTLDVQQAYDPVGKVLYLGDGTQRRADALGPVIHTVAGNGTAGFGGDGGPATQAALQTPRGLAVGPDGSLYIADAFNFRVRRVAPDGVITTVAGNGTAGFGGDGGPATQAELNNAFGGLAVGPDGSLYIADRDNGRVRRVGPDGIITTVAGGGTNSSALGDGGPATQAFLSGPDSVAVGPDGSLYVRERSGFRVRRVGPDGIIRTIAGGGTSFADGIPASQSQLGSSSGIAVGTDGSLYFGDGTGPSGQGERVRRVGTDGIITIVAGGGTAVPGDGGRATDALLNDVSGLAVGADGSVYVVDAAHQRVRRVDAQGVITTVAGNGTAGFGGDGGPADQAEITNPGEGSVAVAPDGSLYVADSDNSRVRRVAAFLPGLAAGGYVVARADASEVYTFDAAGRHLQTVDALTGAVVYQFGYTAFGRLSTITDRDGNVTAVERDARATPPPWWRRAASAPS
jgi:YD repeat-containing protein